MATRKRLGYRVRRAMRRQRRGTVLPLPPAKQNSTGLPELLVICASCLILGLLAGVWWSGG